MKNTYVNKLDAIMKAAQGEIFDLRRDSMMQRSMLVEFFHYYCDALFYSRFETCKRSAIATISDNFSDILKKLTKIEWDSEFGPGEATKKYRYDVIVSDDKNISFLKKNRWGEIDTRCPLSTIKFPRKKLIYLENKLSRPYVSKVKWSLIEDRSHFHYSIYLL